MNEKAKWIDLTMEDGAVFRVCAEFVARNRADTFLLDKGYGEFEPEDIPDAIADEMAWVLKDEHELVDWLLNNMDWDELPAFMFKDPTQGPVYGMPSSPDKCKLVFTDE